MKSRFFAFLHGVYFLHCKAALCSILPLVCRLFHVKIVFFLPQMHFLDWPPFSCNRFNGILSHRAEVLFSQIYASLSGKTSIYLTPPPPHIKHFTIKYCIKFLEVILNFPQILIIEYFTSETTKIIITLREKIYTYEVSSTRASLKSASVAGREFKCKFF